jgi:hypothetical protein
MSLYVNIPASTSGGTPAYQTGTLDFTGTGTTSFVPANAGKNWRTDQMRIRIITNTLVGAATFSVGTNGAAFNNVIPATNIGGAFPADITYPLPGLGAAALTFPVVSISTTALTINCSVAGTGGVLTVSFQVWGEYI